METKICSKCRIEKLAIYFYKCKNNPDGYNYWCKECIDNYNKYRSKSDKEKVKNQIKEWHIKNAEKDKLRRSKWRKNNPEKMKEYAIKSRQWYKDNIDQAKKTYQKYRENNIEKINKCQKEWRDRNKDKVRMYQRKAQKKRNKNLNIRLHKNISSAIYRSLKGNKNECSWKEIVGYDTIQLKKHLEVQFQNGMTWNNYGKNGWVLDHKIPISLFNITSAKCKGFKNCWALENLQPLWEKDNLRKRDNLFE